MKYPLPSYAATIWYNGQGFTLILPAGDGERRFTFDRLADAEEALRTHHAQATVEREARLTNKFGGTAVLEGNGARVEFDLTGGRFAHLAPYRHGPSAEELRRIGDRILAEKRAADRAAAAERKRAKKFTLEDLGL